MEQRSKGFFGICSMEYASPMHTLKLLGFRYISNQARALSLIPNLYSSRFINISWSTELKATDRSITIKQEQLPPSIVNLLKLSHNCILLYMLIGNQELVHTLSSAC